MKSCQFHDSHFVAMYHDGVLPKDMEKVFSDHLLSCSECMEALLHLESDLFIMQSMEFKPLPQSMSAVARDELQKSITGKDRVGYSESTTVEKALFKLFKGKLKLIKNLFGENQFQTLALSPMRGGEEFTHKLEKNGIAVELEPDGETSFRIELNGIRGKSIILRRNNRMIETHSVCVDERLVISDLEKGSFSLYIDGEEHIGFVVE